MEYMANPGRYDQMTYHRCGASGLMLPAVSLGLWHNFGGVNTLSNMKEMLFTAFDLGITHMDLANNYGPPPGSAEENFGRIMRDHLGCYRDELVISTKAGFTMWPGPYGDWGSRKYLLASLDQSLRRMGLDYVDIFYSHRPDPETPIEETVLALDHAVRQGKALYVGLSNYTKAQVEAALPLFRELKTPFIIHQPRYSMLDRWIEADGLKDYAHEQQFGLIAFSPLAQGLLTNRYLGGIPADSRAASGRSNWLTKDRITEEQVVMVQKLAAMAERRGQSLAQMALAWVLRGNGVTSVLIGASRADQIRDCVGCLKNRDFSPEELAEIDTIIGV